MRYFKKIEGERLYLSPINTDDLVIYTKWMNDPEVTGFIGTERSVNSLQTERDALNHLAGSGYNFAIICKEGDRLMGNISLMGVDSVSRRAEIGVFIGEPGDRGKGYGTEAIRLILRFGFLTLNLHNVMLKAHGDNLRGIACYIKCGFKEFGRQREAKFKQGGYVDIVYMDILDSEFTDAQIV